MAVDTTNLKNLKTEIADSSKDVADLTKSVNKLISDSKTLSSSTLENSQDLATIYQGILGTVKDIYNTDKKNKLVEDALKNISNQRQEILNEVNEHCSQLTIIELTLSPEGWQNDVSRLDHQLERPDVPPSPFNLRHLWVDLRSKKTDNNDDTSSEKFIQILN